MRHLFERICEAPAYLWWLRMTGKWLISRLVKRSFRYKTASNPAEALVQNIQNV